LNLPAANPQEIEAAHRRSVLLVFTCTVLGAAAQILMKTGMSHFVPDPIAIVTNIPLMAG
jgi:hypothetical protein